MEKRSQETNGILLGLVALAKKLHLRPFAVFMSHRFGIWTAADYIAVGRKMQSARGLRRLLLQIRLRRLETLLGIDIPNFSNIGKNLTIIHDHDVYLSANTIIGDDCVIYRGAGIGTVRDGKRAGEPVIEDRVVIGSHAFVVGGITVGHDSMIAANAFVDFDVPPHSIVVGNPGVIHHKEYASRAYLCLKD